MKLKAQALLNGKKLILDRHGEAALTRVLERCSPAIQERVQTAIAIEWHPLEEFLEFLEVAERVLGLAPGQASREIGAEAARQNTKGVFKRSVFYFGSPGFLLRRIAGMWSQFNDEGEMLLLHLDTAHALIEVRGTSTIHALFCETLVGWAEVVTDACGLRVPKVRHTECRARGDARCIWHVTWARAATEEHESALHKGYGASSSSPPGPPTPRKK